MKKIILIVFALQNFLLADINVAVSYPFIAALTQKVGGEHVEITTLAKGNWDPHFVVARPSLIHQVSRADLLIINGAGLEIGWMPPLIRQSHNRHIQSGTKGFLDLSQFVDLINKPVAVSRANGDIHPDGNPHYSTDPYIMPTLADAIASRLALLDPDNASSYRSNADTFKKGWEENLVRWEKAMAGVKGKKLIQYHELFNYFLKRYDLVSVGNIEPLPGINPSSRHTLELIKLMKAENVTLILQDVYHSPKTARYIAEKSGAKEILMPHDVHAVHEADTLAHLYDTMVERVTQP